MKRVDREDVNCVERARSGRRLRCRAQDFAGMLPKTAAGEVMSAIDGLVGVLERGLPGERR